ARRVLRSKPRPGGAGLERARAVKASSFLARSQRTVEGDDRGKTIGEGEQKNSFPAWCHSSITLERWEAAMMNKNQNPRPASPAPKLSEGQLQPLFRRLNLAHTRSIYQDVADRAEKENWSYRDFLALLLAEEVAHR